MAFYKFGESPSWLLTTLIVSKLAVLVFDEESPTLKIALHGQEENNGSI